MALFQDIVVPIDHSEHSFEALRVAIDVARSFGAKLHLIHVLELRVYALPEGALMPTAREIADRLQDGEAMLDKAAGAARDAGIDADRLVAQGSPAAEIVGHARDVGAQLVIMGTHGRTGLRHLLLGSVAEKVIREAPCSVLTVPLPARPLGRAANA